MCPVACLANCSVARLLLPLPREIFRNCSINGVSLVFVGRCYVCGDYENDVFVEVDKCKTDNETGSQVLCPSGFCAVSFFNITNMHSKSPYMLIIVQSMATTLLLLDSPTILNCSFNGSA